MRRNPEDVYKDQNNPTPFGPPVVSPGVTDPSALRYAAGIASRKGPPRYTQPVGGGPTPPIPRLDLPADTGLTMADQANMQRAAQAGPPQAGTGTPVSRGGMFQGMPSPDTRLPAGPTGLSRPPAGLLPIDILPEEARQDSEFKEGQGSMYASAQPALAYKYGVIRNGKRLMPQAIGQANKGLSEKTTEGLLAIQAFQQQRQQAEGPDASAAERDAAQSASGAAGRLGNAPGDGPRADPQATQKNITEAVKKLDDFDFNTFREMMMKDIINNEDQREIIEKRCKPLDLTDLIVKGFVTQKVPIVPLKFEPTFRSMTGSEDLAIKRLIMSESKGLEVNERYLLDKFSLMAVTVGLDGLNNNVFPDHRDADGHFNEENFWKKFTFVTKYPFHMLASLGVNYFWFDIRVRKLFVAEKLGNG